MKAFSAATAALTRQLGGRVVFTDDAALSAASFDSAKIPFRPAAVVRARSEADVGAVLELANKLGVQSIAEGIETAEEYQWALKHGADFVQGYLFGAPDAVPATASVIA